MPCSYTNCRPTSVLPDPGTRGDEDECALPIALGIARKGKEAVSSSGMPALSARLWPEVAHRGRCASLRRQEMVARVRPQNPLLDILGAVRSPSKPSRSLSVIGRRAGPMRRYPVSLVHEPPGDLCRREPDRRQVVALRVVVLRSDRICLTWSTWPGRVRPRLNSRTINRSDVRTNNIGSSPTLARQLVRAQRPSRMSRGRL